jgi:hypothetical protein
MKKYERIGTICLILAVASLALGLFANQWFLALGAVLGGASIAFDLAAREISNHAIKIICADVAKEEDWYNKQQYDFMLK